MTDIPQNAPGTEEPLILERLSDLDNQDEYLAHYPDIRGQAVVNPTGDEVGTVDDLYVNPRDRQVEMAAMTLSDAAGFGGKRILVPVEEIELVEGRVEILAKKEHVQLAPEFHEGAPSYEPYYEYWSSQTVGAVEEPSEGVIRPHGRLKLEGEEPDEEEEPRRASYG